MSFRGLGVFFVIFLLSFDLVGQNDTVKVIGTLFAKKMVDAAAAQGANGQVLVSDSLGYLYFKDSGINYPIPVELDSLSQLDSIEHKTGLVATVKNNGSFISDGEKWIRIACNIRLSNVQQLRKLPRQSCPVYVQSYYDSINYGGGYFQWVAHDKLGHGDDGGNIFAAKDTGFWMREEIKYKPSYYGAVDSSDQKYSKFKTSTEAIQRCIDAAGKYGTIEFDNGFVYNNGGSLNFKEGQILNGNNVIIRRVNRLQTTIVSHSQGSDIIQVADSTVFETGMSIVAKINGQYSYTYRIMAKNGKDLTLYGAMTLLDGEEISFQGAEVFTSSYQIVAVSPNIRIENVILDGNRENNASNNRWEFSGELYSQSANGKFMNMNIINSPGESINLFGSNPLLRNINISNGNGNGIHLGTNDRYTIDNIRIENVNLLALEGDFSLGHEGGAIANSDNVHGGLVHNVYVENALAVVGRINGEDDSGNNYDKLTGVNCKKAFEIIQLPGSSGLKDIFITNSKFVNCNKFEINSNLNTAQSSFGKNIKLRNVDLNNTSLIISRTDSVFLESIFFSSTLTDCLINFDEVTNSSLNNLKMNGGKYLSIGTCNNLIISNFDIATNLGNMAINTSNSVGHITIRNGSIKHENCPSGFRGIYGGPKTIIENVYIKISGPAICGIEVNTSTESRATIVKSCNINTSQNVPSIRCFSGTQNNYMINNIINQPVVDNGNNFELGSLFIPE